MSSNSVGISDLSIYLPENKIGLDKILDQRSLESPDQAERLRKAVASTDQIAIRFPSSWEDSAVLGANASYRLLDQCKGEIGKLRYFVVGTETSVDLSKSMSAYIQGMLDKTPYRLPTRITSYQVQHACAGATLAMLSVAGLLQAAGRPGETGISIATDIARYDANSTAEYTQGSGAAAMLVEGNPKLLSLDLETQGFSSRDVDDFFRPISSLTARVKGRFSIQCYNDALEEAFLDYCERAALEPDKALEQTNYFVFHVPFARMASSALRRLLSKHLGLDSTASRDFLEPRRFHEALEVTAEVGNMYTGAIYLNLAATLLGAYEEHGDKIVGKKILFSSYGSGNTMVVFSGQIMPGAPKVIERWKTRDLLNDKSDRDFDSYQEWLNRNYDSSTYQSNGPGLIEKVRPGSFFLQSIREDGYRNYEFKAPT